MAGMDFSRYEWMTFDCYGTLIDWDAGILSVLGPMVRGHGRKLSDAGILELYAAIERVEEREYKTYRQVMEAVVAKMAARLAFTPTSAELRALPDALGGWAPFPDTVAALKKLKSRYKLGIISNTDDDLFARTARHLEVKFDAVTTAQMARSYKPSVNNFKLALERMGAAREKVLHVAQSLFHHIAPANELGIASVWVNRRSARGTAGPTSASGAVEGSAKPDWTVEDLRSLADLGVGS